MFKLFVITLSIATLPTVSFGNNIPSAPNLENERLESRKMLLTSFQKEYAFLEKQLRSLQAREDALTKELKELDKVGETKLANQQKVLLKEEAKVELTQGEIDKYHGRETKQVEANDVFVSTLLGARETVGLKFEIEEISVSDPLFVELLTETFSKAKEKLEEYTTTHKKRESFFTGDGKSVEGEILYLGNIAAYGMSSNERGPLRPVENSRFKIASEDRSSTEKVFSDNQTPTFNAFLLDASKGIPKEKQSKSFSKVIDDGGFVGNIILLLAALAIIITIWRFVMLRVLSENSQSEFSKIIDAVQTGDLTSAILYCQKPRGALGRIIKTTISSLKATREEQERKISESIIGESIKIDRMGSVLFVIASVAPLLGLLGTVTGMISTFDIITNEGTGNPKLLASGISEALVTTMLGLSVAIPTLVLGNLLNNWTKKIKSSIEHSNLAVINAYENKGTE